MKINLNELEWKPITELDLSNGMPVGVILKYKTGPYDLIGTDLAGTSSKGCGCCSGSWKDELGNVESFAILEFTPEIR